jgi:hypothetical protein
VHVARATLGGAACALDGCRVRAKSAGRCAGLRGLGQTLNATGYEGLEGALFSATVVGPKADERPGVVLPGDRTEKVFQATAGGQWVAFHVELNIA